MTLDQLRIFVAVAEQQHVTRAANVLALSQSAVSSSIAALEAQYDVKLFHRIRRNIVLTDAGQQFLNEAPDCGAVRYRSRRVRRWQITGYRR